MKKSIVIVALLALTGCASKQPVHPSQDTRGVSVPYAAPTHGIVPPYGSSVRPLHVTPAPGSYHPYPQ